MVRAHPLQNVYFNALAGKNWKSKFDVDYWGLSNRMALEYILERDQARVVRVYPPGLGFVTPLILKKDFRARFAPIELIGNADYITDYFAIPDSQFELFHEIKVGNEVITSIYKRKGAHLPLPDLALGQRVDFSKNGIGKEFLIGVGAQQTAGWGWSFPEPWGVWSDGEKAQLVIPLPRTKPNTLDLELIAYINPKHPEQIIEIYLDGKLQKKEKLSKKDISHVDLIIPPDISRNYIKIEFKLINPVRPKDLDGTDDNRQLGIGLVGATFR